MRTAFPQMLPVRRLLRIWVPKRSIRVLMLPHQLSSFVLRSIEELLLLLDIHIF
jgi:hypothetical protein